MMLVGQRTVSQLYSKWGDFLRGDSVEDIAAFTVIMVCLLLVFHTAYKKIWKWAIIIGILAFLMIKVVPTFI